MKRTAIATTSTQPAPGLSPEFTAWLNAERSASHRRMAIVRTALLVLLSSSLFILAQPPTWVNVLFALIRSTTQP